MEAMVALGPEVVVGNHVADALAGRAASSAELPAEAVQSLQQLRDKATRVLKRAVAIGIVASAWPKEPGRVLKPAPKPRRRALLSLKAAKRGTSHSVVPLGNRRWRCTKCLGVSPASLPAKWFPIPCPERSELPSRCREFQDPILPT